MDIIDDNYRLSLATSLEKREALGYKEGQYHRSQEQGPGEFTTRYGVDLTKFPKNPGESDFDHFKRVYSKFETTHQAAIKRFPKADSRDLLKLIWNTGVYSSPSKALTQGDVTTPIGRKKMFASINGYIGVDENAYWSSGLVTARAKDWNVIAKTYNPDMVITEVRYREDYLPEFKEKKIVFRDFYNAKGTILRTMYSTKPLHPKNKDVIGKTIKIGDD